jgi:hypothetical protein
MKLPRRRVLYLAAGAVALPAVSRIAWAQAYPSRPVRIIVGFPAGGGVDIIARVIGQWLSERLGQPFIIENRPGGGNNIGTEAVVRAPADGYTLLLAGTPNAVNATLYDKLAARLILFDLEIYRRLLTAVTLNLVLNGLSFIERCQSGTFDGTDVYEHIFSTSLRLNEPVAFGRIEPLHSAGSHAGLLLNRTATE